MAVVLITNVKKYIGLSTDTKPTNGLKIGSEFYETDTGQNWFWEGSNWVEDLTIINAINKTINQ